MSLGKDLRRMREEAREQYILKVQEEEQVHQLTLKKQQLARCHQLPDIQEKIEAKLLSKVQDIKTHILYFKGPDLGIQEDDEAMWCLIKDWLDQEGINNSLVNYEEGWNSLDQKAAKSGYRLEVRF